MPAFSSTSLSMRSTEEQLADFPQVRASVLNYGVPSFSGRRGSDFNKDELEREIREVLHVFEPRLKRNSIKVKVSIGDKTGLRIVIDGVLLLSPVPERLRLSTAIDLDNGNHVVDGVDGLRSTKHPCLSWHKRHTHRLCIGLWIQYNR